MILFFPLVEVGILLGFLGLMDFVDLVMEVVDYMTRVEVVDEVNRVEI